jgi:hypothetical protein
MGRKVSAATIRQAESAELAERLMRPVAKVAAKRVMLIIEHVSKLYVEPLDRRIAQLEAEIVRLGGVVPPED